MNHSRFKPFRFSPLVFLDDGGAASLVSCNGFAFKAEGVCWQFSILLRSFSRSPTLSFSPSSVLIAWSWFHQQQTTSRTIYIYNDVDSIRENEYCPNFIIANSQVFSVPQSWVALVGSIPRSYPWTIYLLRRLTKIQGTVRSKGSV